MQSGWQSVICHLYGPSNVYLRVVSRCPTAGPTSPARAVAGVFSAPAALLALLTITVRWVNIEEVGTSRPSLGLHSLLTSVHQEKQWKAEAKLRSQEEKAQKKIQSAQVRAGRERLGSALKTN